MKSYLNEKNMKFKVEAENWEVAVIEAGRLLTSCQIADSVYTDSMISFIRRLGPYCVISPGIAMPHGRPEDGVKKNGLALLTLKKPVVFGHEENDPVSIVVALAAVDDHSHVRLLSALAKFLMKKENVSQLKKASEYKDVRNIIEQEEG